VLSTTSATTAATNHQRAGDHAPIAVKANAGTDNKKMQLFKDLVRDLQK